MFVSLLSTPLIIQLYHKRNILSVSQGMISMIYFNLNVIVYANVIELPVNISAAYVYLKYRINPTKIKHHLPSWNQFKRLLSGIVRSFERIYHFNWTGSQSFTLPLIDSLTLECFVIDLPVHRVTTWYQSCFFCGKPSYYTITDTRRRFIKSTLIFIQHRGDIFILSETNYIQRRCFVTIRS